MKEIWSIRDYEFQGKKDSMWTKIGMAYQNKDGSYTLKFDLFPTNPLIKINLREKTNKEHKEHFEYGESGGD